MEDYLAFCEERGETAERPFSGKFNLRGQDLLDITQGQIISIK